MAIPKELIPMLKHLLKFTLSCFCLIILVSLVCNTAIAKYRIYKGMVKTSFIDFWISVLPPSQQMTVAETVLEFLLDANYSEADNNRTNFSQVIGLGSKDQENKGFQVDLSLVFHHNFQPMNESSLLRLKKVLAKTKEELASDKGWEIAVKKLQYLANYAIGITEDLLDERLAEITGDVEEKDVDATDWMRSSLALPTDRPTATDELIKLFKYVVRNVDKILDSPFFHEEQKEGETSGWLPSWLTENFQENLSTTADVD